MRSLNLISTPAGWSIRQLCLGFSMVYTVWDFT